MPDAWDRLQNEPRSRRAVARWKALCIILTSQDRPGCGAPLPTSLTLDRHCWRQRHRANPRRPASAVAVLGSVMRFGGNAIFRPNGWLFCFVLPIRGKLTTKQASTVGFMACFLLLADQVKNLV
jgi:hypothetical protein